jgi:hypothetical protein
MKGQDQVVFFISVIVVIFSTHSSVGNDDNTQMYGNSLEFCIYSVKNLKRCFSEAKELFFVKKDQSLFA